MPGFSRYVVLLTGSVLMCSTVWASDHSSPDPAAPADSAALADQTKAESKDDFVSANSFETAAEDAENHGENSASAAESKSGLDRSKEYVDSQVRRASLWVDGFFDDPNHVAEATTTQIRIRPEFYYREEQGAKFKFKGSVKISLPGLKGKVSLIGGSDENDDESGDTGKDAEGESVVGLQFFLSSTARWNTSIVAGVKFNDFAGIAGPRFRYQAAMGENSSMRFTQTFRYQTNDYWDIGSRLDLNFLVSDHLFFRQTVYGRWRGEESDETGYRTSVSSVLSRKLSDSAGLQFDFTTIFHTEPDAHVDKYTLALRYRKRTKRDWLYYEIVPQVSFEDEYNFKANPGIRLRLELFFGGTKTSEFWKRSAEDDEDFRW